jgi:CheY-like chemotaxis protein
MANTPKGLILVVDDEEAIQDLTAVILESRGYEIARASNGVQAIESINERRPDLILLDIMMPVLDGWGVMEHVRTMEDPPRVVVATGMQELVPPGNVSHYIAGYLIKPFAVDQLVKNAETVLGAPPVIVASGSRRDDRRTFVVEATLLSDTGQQLARGHVVQLSKRGFRMEIGLPFRLGDLVRVGFVMPGRDEPVQLTGRVRWHNDAVLGAEIQQLDPRDEELLCTILEN